jgi:GIY-YIG catalytic domain.
MPQNKFSIKNLLYPYLKDNIPPEKKSGIYQIKCKDCEKIYIGKTKIDLKTKVKGHFRNIKMEK